MATELKRLKETQENELFKAYDILSNAGFELLIEDGFLSVWSKGANIELDYEEGIVIVPNEYQDEFDQRQEQLYEEE